MKCYFVEEILRSEKDQPFRKIEFADMEAASVRK